MIFMNILRKILKRYAVRFVNSLINSTLKLESIPLCGRVVPELDNTKIREVIYQNYRIVYKTFEEIKEVHILAIVHSARDFDKAFRTEWEL
jgi:toxin ParE1/3/4